MCLELLPSYCGRTTNDVRRIVFVSCTEGVSLWFAASVICGLFIVGITDFMYQAPGESKGRNSLITGNLLIVLAQVVSACQMVYEEKYVAGTKATKYINEFHVAPCIQ